MSRDYVTLLGTEEVQRAGISMVIAAEDMQRVASTIESTLFQVQRSLDDWLIRLDEVLTKHKVTIQSLQSTPPPNQPPQEG